MEVMIKAQSLDQYLWSVTKWWPRVKARLYAMKEVIEKQLVNNEIILQEELFPKLNQSKEVRCQRVYVQECGAIAGLDGRQ